MIILLLGLLQLGHGQSNQIKATRYREHQESFLTKIDPFWPKLGPASNSNLTFISFRSIMAFNCPIFFRTWSVFHSMDNQSWQFSRTICPSVPTEFAEDHDDALWVMIDLKIVPPVSWLWFWFILARIELPFCFKLQALHFLSIIFWFISSNIFQTNPKSFFFGHSLTVTFYNRIPY